MTVRDQTAGNTNTGIVTRLEGEFAWVEVVSGGSCGSCKSQGGCGSGLLGLTASPRQYRLPNDVGARPGDTVTITMPDGGVVKAALLSYLLPLALGIAGAAAGMRLGGADAHALIGLGLGVGAGLLVLRRASLRREPWPRISLQSQVIRLQPRLHEES
jgi:sigma-E factor negative regulatory protein RseC